MKAVIKFFVDPFIWYAKGVHVAIYALFFGAKKATERFTKNGTATYDFDEFVMLQPLFFVIFYQIAAIFLF